MITAVLTLALAFLYATGQLAAGLTRGYHTTPRRRPAPAPEDTP